ncbi:MAG: thiamine-phosphate pyrophosphorylase [Helicobacteraceae bacterium]|jgi:thiamine-phosphate pyrophosphorylase|nr:thiamine-phosphate pyrophosphorylase [Helicobacteraceae bacterium]
MKTFNEGWLRVIDANLNRLREAIRVVEDLCRYVFDDAAIAKSLKTLRHKARSALYDECLNSRDSDADVLRPTLPQENARNGAKSVFIANFKRAQESARVLEEALKIDDPQESEIFKSIRYELYSLEKLTLEKYAGKLTA